MTKADPHGSRPKDFQPLKGKKRTLSRFLANELLYDYATGNLDKHRVASVDDFLRTSKETQNELEALRLGIEFCDQLSQTETSPELMYKLSQVRSWHSRVLRVVHWRNWPEVTKWTLEALVISLLVAFVAVIGWPKLAEMLPAPRSDLTLAQVEKEKTKVPLPPEDQLASSENQPANPSQLFAATDSKQGQSLSSEQVETSGKAQAQAAKPRETAPQEAKSIGSQNDKTSPEKPSSVIVTASTEQSQKSAVAASDKPTESAKLKSMKAAPTKPKLKGFVYRVYMDLGNLDYATEQIRTEIQTLGGEKAGKVRLGWRKPKGSYFHFSLLETNYDTLVDKLKAFGPVRIFKDPHWKVMPEGEIRFILWVEDKDLKSDSDMSEGEARAKVEKPTQEEGLGGNSSTSTKESTQPKAGVENEAPKKDTEPEPTTPN
jgi:hypothetical protein